MVSRLMCFSFLDLIAAQAGVAHMVIQTERF
jgi:hypothetical protein